MSWFVIGGAAAGGSAKDGLVRPLGLARHGGAACRLAVHSECVELSVFRKSLAVSQVLLHEESTMFTTFCNLEHMHDRA